MSSDIFHELNPVLVAQVDAFAEVVEQRNLARDTTVCLEQEMAAAERVFAELRELHAPEPLSAGEYEDGTCAACNLDMGGPRPLLRRYKGHLNGAKTKTWMHDHPDWFPNCGSCAGYSTYDASLADWPCATAAALGMTLPPEWVKP